MRAPNQEDHRVSDVWSKLLEGAARSRFGAALEAVSRMLGASHACLVRSEPDAPWMAADQILLFDGASAPTLSLGHLRLAKADQALAGIVRQRGSERHLLVAVRQGAPFAGEEPAWLRLLLPQFRAALDLADKLAPAVATNAGASQFTELVPMPCLLTDEAGRCLARNEAFGKSLEALSGAIRASRIVFAEAPLQEAWRGALLQAHATATVQRLLAKTSTGSTWKLHVVPFACSTGTPGGPAPRLLFVFFERLTSGATQTKTVPSSRPLTRAELEVLASLLQGQTAKMIARARGASVNTVRSQITAILNKTEHRTQKELIASFGSSTFEDAAGDAFDT